MMIGKHMLEGRRRSISLLAALFLVAVTISPASVPYCGLTDACTSSSYQWNDWSCYVSGGRCWVVERKRCDGPPPSVWMYEDYSTFEAYPCGSVECGAGSKCQPPGGGGGSG